MRKDTLYGVPLVNFHPGERKNSLIRRCRRLEKISRVRNARCHQTVTYFNQSLREANGNGCTPLHPIAPPAIRSGLAPEP